MGSHPFVPFHFPIVETSHRMGVGGLLETAAAFHLSQLLQSGTVT